MIIGTDRLMEMLFQLKIIIYDLKNSRKNKHADSGPDMGDPGAQFQMIGLLGCFLSHTHTLSLTSRLLVPFSPTFLLLSGS